MENSQTFTMMYGVQSIIVFTFKSEWLWKVPFLIKVKQSDGIIK